MANVFPRWSDTALRLALIGLGLFAWALLGGTWLFMRTPYNTGQYFAVDQPVQFDHRHHVQDDGIDCRYCHNTVDKSAFAGVPSTELCMGCHSQVWRDSPMLEPVRRSYYRNRPIPWNRVNAVPGFVYFNHSIHVNKGVGCVSCHGRVDEEAAVWQEHTLQMGWCLDCHRDPAPRLRPLDKITDLGWQPPDEPQYGRALAAHYGTRKLDHCTACHR